MTPPRSRILTAVPQTWQVHLEIAKAIRTLAAQEEKDRARLDKTVAESQNYGESAAEIVREILQDLRKAGYRPDQPRWPAGSGDISGRWSGGAGEGPPAPPKAPLRICRRARGGSAITRDRCSKTRQISLPRSLTMNPRFGILQRQRRDG